MLSHVLGVLVAFVSVILLLSMMVTGLVQATQSVFRVRSRNLLKGVGNILRTHTTAAGSDRWKLRRHAARVLNAAEIASVEAVEEPEAFWRQGLLGPKVSWVEPEELARAIKKDLQLQLTAVRSVETTSSRRGVEAEAALTSIAVAKEERASVADSLSAKGEQEAAVAKEAMDPLEEDIRRAAPAWKKRFQYFARLMAIGWSLIVAVAFQVSAPQLLSSLSGDPERTQRIAADSDEVVSLAESELAESEYDLTSDRALTALSEQFPTYEEFIVQAGNAAASKAELIDLLEDVLPDDAQRPAMLRAYGDLIDKEQQTGQRSGPGVDLEVVERQLAAFDIVLWKDPYFYWDQKGLRWDAIFGVLLTTILLSFGAPFWFEQLRNLAALRDLRAPAATSTTTTAKIPAQLVVSQSSEVGASR